MKCVVVKRGVGDAVFLYSALVLRAKYFLGFGFLGSCIVRFTTLRGGGGFASPSAPPYPLAHSAYQVQSAMLESLD